MRKAFISVLIGAWIVTAAPVSLLAAPKADPTPKLHCTTARDYITTLEFLRNEKTLKIPEESARKLAMKVALGCTGSANRFIRVSRLLIGAGLSSPDALKLGESFATRSDTETETFLAVFKTAFVKEGLDLDIGASVRLAKSLTLEFNGDIASVQKDFETVLNTCISGSGLDLPRPQCASLANEVARAGQEWNGSIARPFLDTLKFLRANPGPNLSTGEALTIARELVKYGPEAPRNFTQGYRYAEAEEGLKLGRAEALAFARDLASKSLAQAPAGSELKR